MICPPSFIGNASQFHAGQVCLGRINLSLQKLTALSNLSRVVKEKFSRYLWVDSSLAVTWD